MVSIRQLSALPRPKPFVCSRGSFFLVLLCAFLVLKPPCVVLGQEHGNGVDDHHHVEQVGFAENTPADLETNDPIHDDASSLSGAHETEQSDTPQSESSITVGEREWALRQALQACQSQSQQHRADCDDQLAACQDQCAKQTEAMVEQAQRTAHQQVDSCKSLATERASTLTQQVESLQHQLSEQIEVNRQLSQASEPLQEQLDALQEQVEQILAQLHAEHEKSRLLQEQEAEARQQFVTVYAQHATCHHRSVLVEDRLAKCQGQLEFSQGRLLELRRQEFVAWEQQLHREHQAKYYYTHLFQSLHERFFNTINPYWIPFQQDYLIPGYQYLRHHVVIPALLYLQQEVLQPTVQYLQVHLVEPSKAHLQQQWIQHIEPPLMEAWHDLSTEHAPRWWKQVRGDEGMHLVMTAWNAYVVQPIHQYGPVVAEWWAPFQRQLELAVFRSADLIVTYLMLQLDSTYDVSRSTPTDNWHKISMAWLLKGAMHVRQYPAATVLYLQGSLVTLVMLYLLRAVVFGGRKNRKRRAKARIKKERQHQKID